MYGRYVGGGLGGGGGGTEGRVKGDDDGGLVLHWS